MKKVIAILLCLLWIAALAGCGKSAADTVIAEIGDYKIYASQLFEELDYQLYTNMDGQLEPEMLQQQADAVFEALLSHYVALSKAEELGMDGLTDAQQAEVSANVRSDLEGLQQYYYESFAQQYPTLSRNELNAMVAEELQISGYSEEALTIHYANALIYDTIFAYYTASVELSREQAEAGYAALVEE